MNPSRARQGVVLLGTKVFERGPIRLFDHFDHPGFFVELPLVFFKIKNIDQGKNFFFENTERKLPFARTGRNLWNEIDEAIRKYEKLVLIASESSLTSPAVNRQSTGKSNEPSF